MLVILRNNDEHSPESVWLPRFSGGLYLAYKLGHRLSAPCYEHCSIRGQLIDDLWQLGLSLFSGQGIHDGVLRYWLVTHSPGTYESSSGACPRQRDARDLHHPCPPAP